MKMSQRPELLHTKRRLTLPRQKAKVMMKQTLQAKMPR